MDKEALKEFKEIYERVFGEKLEEEKAREKAKRFLNLLKIIYCSNEKEEKEKSIS